jgi:hypothetical protein
MIEENTTFYTPDTCVWCGRFIWSVPLYLAGTWFCSNECRKAYELHQVYLEEQVIGEAE